MIRLTVFLFIIVLAAAAANGWQSSVTPPTLGDGSKSQSNELFAHEVPRCDSGWLCIEPLQHDSQLSFYVANRKPVPLTVTLRIDADGVRGADRRVITATVDGHSRENFVTLVASEPGETMKFGYRFAWTVGRQDARHQSDYVYRLPYASGERFRVLQSYGSRFSHTGYEHFAVDFKMPEGTPVFAARDGIVARLEESNDKGCYEAGCASFANFVVILHSDSTTSEYYHLQKNGVLVAEGEQISAGQEIARSGNTGHSTMPHLHFAVYKAASWGNTQSIPVRFETAGGIIDKPRRGGYYAAP